VETLTRNRLALLASAVILGALTVTARVVQLQIVDSERLRAKARLQHEQLLEIGGDRGSIVDREGRELAVSVDMVSLYAHPARLREIADPRRVATALAPIVDVPAERILGKLTSRATFVWIRRRVPPSVVQEIKKLGLPFGKGQPLDFETEGKRFYPQRTLAVQVLGFADIDQKGVEGIEKQFDDTLSAGSAKYLAVRDGRGGMVLQLVQPPTKLPQDLVLTLDVELQQIVERELDEAWKNSGSESASAILLDPSTGQILALANRPSGDSNLFGEATPAQRRNRAVVDIYEPGSTFKVITAAAALERGTVTPETMFDCQRGAIQIGRFRIRDHHPYGTLTVREIIEKSSNVGIIKVERTLPRESFYDMIRAFGFGRRTGIELPGERLGIVTPLDRWSALSPASMAMGQEICITALQAVSAMAAVANDGVLVPPRIVLGTRDTSGRFTAAAAPEPRRVISSRTAQTLAGILEGVVARGTGTAAAVGGYRLAGKTGTAQKVSPAGGYSHEKFMASFVGFGPLPRPRLAGMVLLDSPSGGRYYGGQVAAPALGRIMADALAHLRVPPDDMVLPQIASEEAVEKTTKTARKGAKDSAGEEETEEVEMATGPIATEAGQVPDVRGMSLREAVVALAARGYRARVYGSGAVTDQTPAPGTAFQNGQTCVIRLGEPRKAERDSRTATPALIATSRRVGPPGRARR
jgi:cell division protein FtsI/penicillin-binding protein 2